MPLGRKTFGALLLLIAVGASSLDAVSFSRIGDVEIFVNSTSWKCDRIYCPEETHLCHVTKRKAPNDPAQLVRTNVCYAQDKRVLRENTTYEQIDPSLDVQLDVKSSRNGIISSSSGSSYGSSYGTSYGTSYGSSDLDSGEASEEARRVQDEVEANLGRINERIEQQLQGIEENVRRNSEQLERQMDDMRRHLAETFAGIKYL